MDVKDEILEVIKDNPLERMLQRILEQIVGVPVPRTFAQIHEAIRNSSERKRALKAQEKEPKEARVEQLGMLEDAGNFWSRIRQVSG